MICDFHFSSIIERLIMSNENKLDDKKAELIAQHLFLEGIYNFGVNTDFFGRIQKVAAKLDFIEHVEGIETGNTIILSDNDYIKVSDIIWKFILKGYLAPGRNKSNSWFPDVHLTEEGKKYRQKLFQEVEDI